MKLFLINCVIYQRLIPKFCMKINDKFEKYLITASYPIVSMNSTFLDYSGENFQKVT
jgi:hypothetical protein